MKVGDTVYVFGESALRGRIIGTGNAEDHDSFLVKMDEGRWWHPYNSDTFPSNNMFVSTIAAYEQNLTLEPTE